VPITSRQSHSDLETLPKQRKILFSLNIPEKQDRYLKKKPLPLIEPVLIGVVFEQDFRPDDISYVVDPGLITPETNGTILVANPIYQEIIPRELSCGVQSGMTIKPE
jgi:hypothetical protein